MKNALGFLAVVALAACASRGEGTNPEDMSAAEHRRAAASEGDEARQHEARYDPGVPGGDLPGSPGWLASGPRHLGQSAAHEAHARQHREAAEALERSEAAECGSVPAASRAACPFEGRVTAMDELPDGVRLHLADPATVGALVARARCHIAYSRTQGAHDVASCPLYAPGADVRASADGTALEITSSDAQRVEEIKRRARERVQP